MKKCTFDNTLFFNGRASVDNSLKQHMREAHVATRPFECADCAYVAVRRSALKYHADMVHGRAKRHVCPECDFRSAFYD